MMWRYGNKKNIFPVFSFYLLSLNTFLDYRKAMGRKAGSGSFF